MTYGDYPDLGKVKKILVIKLRQLGDVLLTGAVFTVLRRRFPEAKIDAYVYTEAFPLLEGHPGVDGLVGCDRGWKKLPWLKKLQKEWGLWKRIRKGGYDLVINLTEGDRGALAARVAKAKIRVGFAPKGRWQKKLYTHVVKHCPGLRHTVERNLDALRRIGIFPEWEERELFLSIPSEAQRKVEEWVAGPFNLSFEFIGQEIQDSSEQISSFGAEGKGGPPPLPRRKRRNLPEELEYPMDKPKTQVFILIHPASRWRFKCWPVEKMRALAKELIGRGKRVVFTSGPDEAEKTMVAEIAEGLDALNLSGKVSLKELGALIQKSELLICVDSVAFHMANALKQRVVAIFGPTSDVTWGPWRNPEARIVAQNFSCRPCYQDGCGGSKRSDCLATLPVEMVLKAISSLITIENLRRDKCGALEDR